MIEAVKMFFSKYADFRTRSRRSEFWWMMLFNALLNVVLSGAAVSSLMGAVLSGGDLWSAVAGIGGFSLILLVLMSVYGLVCIIPMLALSVRRLHDLGYSGWYYLIVLVGLCIPFLSFIVGIGWIVVCCLDSKPETNKWGPSPKYRTEE